MQSEHSGGVAAHLPPLVQYPIVVYIVQYTEVSDKHGNYEKTLRSIDFNFELLKNDNAHIEKAHSFHDFFLDILYNVQFTIAHTGQLVNSFECLLSIHWIILKTFFT